MTMNRVLRVLVVDDSAYVRKVVSQLLSRSPFLEVVGTARDGQEALERVVELEPDVVTCDLIMPNLDGVGFVREQMARKPVPIVIVSVASEAGELVLSALDAGAVDFVQKPTALASDRLLEIGDELIAQGARPPPTRALRRPSPGAGCGIAARRSSVEGRVRHRRAGHLDRRPAGAASAGAAAAGRTCRCRWPIVLHMPVGYTELYARKLDELSALHVVEATRRPRSYGRAPCCLRRPAVT